MFTLQLLKIIILSVIFFFGLTQNSWSKDYIWIIGGGPVPKNSQYSIEANVIWIQKVINKFPGEKEIKTYFTDGDNPGHDISFRPADISNTDHFEPISRVFDQDYKKILFRSHNVIGVDGPITKEPLIKALERDFRNLTREDRALIIFQGHGLFSKEPEGNTIRLWGDTELSVSEFEKLILTIPNDAPVLLFFPQCYSGGFWRLINKDGQKSLDLSNAVRCGFFSQSERRESEG